MSLFLFCAFVLVTALQVLIWAIFPARWAFTQKKPTTDAPEGTQPSITIIVCARNEAHNLTQHLPMLLGQRFLYPYEVLLVDDDSSDHTETVVNNLQQQYQHLRYLPLRPKEHPGKKMALQTGIRAARHPTLLLTDADCQPASDQWLAHMATAMPPGGLVLGYAPMLHTGHWLNGWARFETAYTAMQYFATAHAGWPFMGVGRNMGIQRNLFEAVGGFERHLHITGGDDDLLVNNTATGRNTGLCLAPEAFVYSTAKTTLRGWLLQKQRHLTAGLGYKFWHNMVLGGVAFTHAAHYGLAAILLAFFPTWAWWVLGGYLLRLVVVWPTYTRAFAHLREKGLTALTPLYDGMLAVWLGAVAPCFLLFFRKKTW